MAEAPSDRQSLSRSPRQSRMLAPDPTLQTHIHTHTDRQTDKQTHGQRDRHDMIRVDNHRPHYERSIQVFARQKTLANTVRQ